MPGTVTVQPGGKQFHVDGNESILESALRAGLALDYGCSNGNCGMCKARLLDGEIRKVQYYDYRLKDAGPDQILLCSYTATTDLTIEAHEATNAEDIPRQQIEAKVKKVAPLNSRYTLMHLQTPRTKRLRFLAGQAADLDLGTVGVQNHPIASCPCDDRNIHFHIDTALNTAFTQAVSGLAHNDTVTIQGPGGSFVLQQDSPGPALFLAFESGFAPIKSLIEHAMQLETHSPMQLVWLSRAPQGRYMENLIRSWTDVFDDFSYSPVSISGHALDVAVRGCLQTITNGPQASEYCIYVAGPVPIADAAANILKPHAPARLTIQTTP